MRVLTASVLFAVGLSLQAQDLPKTPREEFDVHGPVREVVTHRKQLRDDGRKWREAEGNRAVFDPQGRFLVEEVATMKREWIYDEHGRLQQMRSSNGPGTEEVSRYSYSDDESTQTITSSEGAVTIAHSVGGHVVSSEDRHPTFGTSFSRYWYDESGRQVSFEMVSDRFKSAHSTEYDPSGRVLLTRDCFPEGACATSKYAYNDAGKLVSQRTYGVRGWCGNDEDTPFITNDTLSKTIETVGNVRTETTYAPDGKVRTVVTTELDDAGRELHQKLWSPTQVDETWSEYKLDARGNWIERRQYQLGPDYGFKKKTLAEIETREIAYY